jgi:hypothetical protein
LKVKVEEIKSEESGGGMGINDNGTSRGGGGNVGISVSGAGNGGGGVSPSIGSQLEVNGNNGGALLDFQQKMQQNWMAGGYSVAGGYPSFRSYPTNAYAHQLYAGTPTSMDYIQYATTPVTMATTNLQQWPQMAAATMNGFAMH